MMTPASTVVSSPRTYATARDSVDITPSGDHKKKVDETFNISARIQGEPAVRLLPLTVEQLEHAL